MVEHRSPKPSVGGSSPFWPAILKEFEIMTGLIKTFQNAKLELSKVIFPTKSQVKSAFISVFIVVTFISLFLALVDLIMSSTLSAILGD